MAVLALVVAGADASVRRRRRGGRRALESLVEVVEHLDGASGPVAEVVQRGAVSDRLVEHGALGHERTPHRPVPMSVVSSTDLAFRLGRCGGSAVHHDADQVERRVQFRAGVVDRAHDRLGAPDRQRGQLHHEQHAVGATIPDFVVGPSDGAQSMRTKR